MKFIPIKSDSSEIPEFRKKPLVEDVVTSVLKMYETNGNPPEEPWVAYLCAQANRILGTCAFKSPPRNGEVEIAYFVFPEYQRKGLGTFFAAFLIAQARLASPQIRILAETLPEKNASTQILERLNFEKLGEYLHPEDGKVWQWVHR